LTNDGEARGGEESKWNKLQECSKDRWRGVADLSIENRQLSSEESQKKKKNRQTPPVITRLTRLIKKRPWLSAYTVLTEGEVKKSHCLA